MLLGRKGMARLPTSAVSPATGAWGASGAVVAFLMGWLLELDTIWCWLLLLSFTAVPMWIREWRKRDERASSPDPGKRELLLGAAVINGLFICSVHVQLAWGGAKGQAIAPLLLPVLAACVGLVLLALLKPSVLSHSIAGCGRAARDMCGRQKVRSADMTDLLGWTVKATFLPLMLGWSFVWMAQGVGASFGRGWLAGYLVAMALLYAVDTAFATIGYMSTSRRIDGQIRSVDRTAIGWLAALCCYPPLSVLVLDTWLVYKGSSDWTQWLPELGVWGVVWGLAIIVLTAVYTWSSVAFGPRFSNLTHRGIITSGPYRWVKHPAYLTKNLSWWLISVPFLSKQGVETSLLLCFSLLGVNSIYALRAWTEERHLRSDPVYRDYALWIAEYGLVARAMRVCTRLAGRPQRRTS